MLTETTVPCVRDLIAETAGQCNVAALGTVQKCEVNCHWQTMTAVDTYEVESMVRGYHIYRDVWEAAVGQTLQCQWEAGNPHDPYVVFVTQGETIVGYVPRAISAVCSLFLRRNGAISCEVMGTRCKSSALPQGGLEIPCK